MAAIAGIVLAATSTSAGTTTAPTEALALAVTPMATDIPPTPTPPPTSTPTPSATAPPTNTATPSPTPQPPDTATPLPTTPPNTATLTAPAPTPTKAGPSGAYLGAWIPGLPKDLSKITALESKVGKKMTIIHYYQGWVGRDMLDAASAQAIANHGSIPMITWEPWDYTKGINQPAYNTINIAAGSFDSFITAYAQSVKNYGQPIFLRFAHEMNGHTYPWSVDMNGNTAQSYVAAWRHVHDIFTQVGATNVIWVWSPNIKYEGTAPFQDVYPGDNYVDWMALDAYNGGTAVPWGGWRPFNDLFAASYQDLTQLSQKPIMIAEVGAVEQGGSKAAWITDAMVASLPQLYPRINAFVWFNEDWFDNQHKEANWQIESSASSLAAYAQAAANPYYKATLGALPLK